MKALSTTLALCLLVPTVATAQEGEEEAPEFGPDGEVQPDRDARKAPSPKPEPEPSPEPEPEPTPTTTEAVNTDEPQSIGEAQTDIAYKLSGNLRVVGSVVQDDPQVQFVGRNDGFRLQNATLGIDSRWKDKVSVRISAEGARDERDTANDVEGTLRFVIKDAYADLHVHNALTVRVARFLPIFELDESTATRDRKFVRSSLESRGVFSTDGFETPGFALRRNLGVALRSDKAYSSGDFNLGYEVAAQNGNGEFDSANDNDALAYSVALLFSKGEIFRAHAAARYNQRTEGELPFRTSENEIAGAAAVVLNIAPVRAAAQVIFKRIDYPTTGGPVENGFGGHGELSMVFPGFDFIEVGYRYGILDDSDLMPNNRVQEHTGGVNLLLPSYNTRLMLNYTHPVEEGGRKLSNDRVEALAEVNLW
jgi:hypothetical protein